MDEEFRAAGRLGHLGGVHRVALNPVESLAAGEPARVAVERPDVPTAPGQIPRKLAADPAGRAEHESRSRLVHLRLHAL